jgi:hypothetical protein
VYKKGKFSAIEEKQVKDAIENFRLVRVHFLSEGSLLECIKQQRHLTEKDIIDIIFAKGDKTRDNAFWIEISSSSFHRFFNVFT